MSRTLSLIFVFFSYLLSFSSCIYPDFDLRTRVCLYWADEWRKKEILGSFSSYLIYIDLILIYDPLFLPFYSPTLLLMPVTFED